MWRFEMIQSIPQRKIVRFQSCAVGLCVKLTKCRNLDDQSSGSDEISVDVGAVMEVVSTYVQERGGKAL